MSDHLIQAGSTGNFITVKPRSASTGNLLAGLVYGGFVCTYQRAGAATATTVTLSAGTLGAYASGSIVETAQGGTYQFCPPNAAVASGAAEVDFKLTNANAIDTTEHVILTGQAGGVGTVDANNNVHGLQTRTVSDGSTIGTGTSTLAASDMLATPANKLSTDSNGRVGVNNFPVEFLSSAEQSELTTTINDLNTLLGRSDTAGNVATISTNIATLLTRIGATLTIANGKVATTLASADVIGSLPAQINAYAAGQDPASLLLANPASKLAADSNGRVGVNNFPVEFLSSAEQTELTTTISDLNTLLGRSDTAGNVSTISTNIGTLLTRISATLTIVNGKVAATVATGDGVDSATALTHLAKPGDAMTLTPAYDAAKTGGSSLNAQETRDALVLAPTAGLLQIPSSVATVADATAVADDDGASPPRLPTPAFGVFQPGSVEQQPVFTVQVIANSPLVLLSRVLDQSGNLITPTGVASVTVTTTDVADDSAVTQTFTPSVVVMPTAVIDARWNVDAAGYNLALTLNGSAVPTPARSYVSTVTVTPTTGSPFLLQWNLQT